MSRTLQNPDTPPPIRPILSKAASRRFVAIITIISITIFISLLFTGSYWPQRFQNPAAKFFVCVLLAFCFSIVMFVVYPQNARIKNIPLINLPVELIGPPALFVTALTLLWYLYPSPPGRFFFVQTQGAPTPFQLETFEIKPLSGGCIYYPTRDHNDKYMLGGIYVEFKGDEANCHATIGNSFVTHPVLFSLGAKTNTVEVEFR